MPFLILSVVQIILLTILTLLFTITVGVECLLLSLLVVLEAYFFVVVLSYVDDLKNGIKENQQQSTMEQGRSVVYYNNVPMQPPAYESQMKHTT